MTVAQNSPGRTLTVSSPHYPRGHDLIERQVKTIKKLFSQCNEDSSWYQMAV